MWRATRERIGALYKVHTGQNLAKFQTKPAMIKLNLPHAAYDCSHRTEPPCCPAF